MDKDELQLNRGRNQDYSEELKELQSLLEKIYGTNILEENNVYIPSYGDVTELNKDRTILELVGKDTLVALCSGVIQILGTSLAIYEKNGDYAFGMFASDWCQLMDSASRKRCPTDDNREALESGEWLCHENCRYDSAQLAMDTGKPTDIDCIGGIKIYAEPIFVGNEVIGAINIGYGEPPTDEKTLTELAQRFQVPYLKLFHKAKAYNPRPPMVINIAKKRLHDIAILIGKIVENAQNKRKLEESEKQFQIITEGSADAITITDQKRNYVYVNQGASVLLGYSKGELLKMNVLDLVSTKKMNEVHAIFYKLLKGEKVFQEVELIKKDGTILPTELNATLLPNGYAYGSLRDISKRKQIEKIALESETRYRNLFNYMSSGVAVYEALDDGRDFIIKDFNHAAEKIDKIDKEKVIGQSVLAVFPQIVEINLFKTIQEVYHTGNPQHHPVSFYQDERMSGWRENYVYKLSSGEVVAVYDDVTERIQAEESLRKSEIKYRQLVETLNEGIVQIDKEGNIDFVNPKMAKILDYTQEEMVGRHILDFLDEKEVPTFHKLLKERMQGQGVAGVYERTFRKKAGKPVHVLLSTIPFYDEQGNYDGAIAGITDISPLKQAKDNLKKSFEGIINILSNLSEVRDFYTAGHQKRVSRLTVAIARELNLNEEQKEAIRIAALIHDIGKIGMPIEILTKPGKLSELEFNLIKEHPQIGYDILKDIDFPYPIAEIIWQHHEKLDGSGYPKHLKGPQIKIEAQILCVADVVEAISSHRPYRPALGIDTALDEIMNYKGVLYNPEVVDACVKLFREKGFQLNK